MQFSWPNFLLSDWNLNSKKDTQRSMPLYLVYHASRMYSQTYERAVGIDWFVVCENNKFLAFLRGRRWETYSSNQTETQRLDIL